MAKKFIICDHQLMIGNVDYHRDLCKRGDFHNIVGGGYWAYLQASNTLYLYGTSEEFGSVTQQQVDEADRPYHLDNATVILTDQDLPF